MQRRIRRYRRHGRDSKRRQLERRHFERWHRRLDQRRQLERWHRRCDQRWQLERRYCRQRGQDQRRDGKRRCEQHDRWRLLLFHLPTSADDWEVPEVFERFDAGSNFQFSYTDLDSLLDAVVLNVGRSTRKKADPPHAKTGTYMRAKVNRATINEGNRFLYEIFRDNEQNQQTLQQIRDRLEQLPAFRQIS